MKTAPCFLLIFLFIQSIVYSQTNTTGLAKATEFTIPVSPAFDLLAVSPSQIARPNNIREFKVDWSFRSWRLKPNIAIQAQPIWELLYNRPDLSRYRKAPRWAKTVSTLDLSAGTIEDADQSRRAALATKINLYRQKDPLEDVLLFKEIDSLYLERKTLLLQQMETVAIKRAISKDATELSHLNMVLDSLQRTAASEALLQKERIKEIADEYTQKNWNAAHLDLAWGKMFSFDNVTFDSLDLKSDAWAIWLNGSIGLGKRLMLNGSIKHLVQHSRDSISVQQNISSGGLGLRFGGQKFSFFTEVVFSKFYDDDKDQADVSDPSSSLNLAQLEHTSMSYGGDWRINRNILLSYGVRIDYNKDFKLKNIIPVASIACMMR